MTGQTGARQPFPWEASYPVGVRWDTPIAMTTLPQLLDTAVARFAGKAALSYGTRTIGYREFSGMVDRLAANLQAIGIGEGQRVALYLPNTPWHPVFFFAVLKAGGTLVHLSPLDADRELKFKLADSGARTIVTTDLGGLETRAAKLVEEGHAERCIIGEDAFWQSLDADQPPKSMPVLSGAALVTKVGDAPLRPVAPAPADVAVLQYTGGTTGRPKAAMLTHANFTATISMYEAWTEPQGLMLRGEERVLCVLPLFHIYALTVVLLTGLATGAEIVLHPRFDAAAVIGDIERRRMTSFPGVPTMWITIANFPGIETRDLKSLTSIRSGGAACPVEIETRIKALTGLRLAGGWGMTETAPAGTSIPTSGIDRPGSIGLPLPGLELRIVALDDPRRALGVGETGEIAIRGPNVISAYWQRPEESRQAFVDGWFLTGDIGHMDAGGFFFLVDRKKDMIISGGFNVYPRTIEEAIYEHPAVGEAVVVGIPDSYRGEAAKAFVSLKPGAEPFTLDDLRAFLADKIGRHEMPAHLEFRATLPKTAVGKLSKRVLIEEERAKRG